MCGTVQEGVKGARSTSSKTSMRMFKEEFVKAKIGHLIFLMLERLIHFVDEFFLAGATKLWFDSRDNKCKNKNFIYSKKFGKNCTLH